MEFKIVDCVFFISLLLLFVFCGFSLVFKFSYFLQDRALTPCRHVVRLLVLLSFVKESVYLALETFPDCTSRLLCQVWSCKLYDYILLGNICVTKIFKLLVLCIILIKHSIHNTFRGKVTLNLYVG